MCRLRRLWTLLLALLLLLTVVGCGAMPQAGASQPGSSSTGEAPAGGEDLFVGNCTPSGPLRLINWPGYLDPEVMQQFGELYGVEVTEDEYTSNEALMARLRTGNSGFDLVFPSDYAIQILSSEGLLAELDRSNIPNITQLNPELMGLYYDPENKYSIPFQWGTVGLAYNKKYFEEPPTSWAYLFEAQQAEGMEGFFTMLDNEREAIGGALFYLGYSANDTDPGHVAAARDLLLKQKGFTTFSGYNSANIGDSLAGEEVVIAQAWSGLTARAAQENEAVAYLIPEEGGVIWQDNMAIPADASNKCTAELFINYILQPDVAAQVLEYSFFSSPVPAAYERLDEETRQLLARFVPDEAAMKRLEWLKPQPETTIYSDTWTEVKSH